MKNLTVEQASFIKMEVSRCLNNTCFSDFSLFIDKHTEKPEPVSLHEIAYLLRTFAGTDSNQSTSFINDWANRLDAFNTALQREGHTNQI